MRNSQLNRSQEYRILVNIKLKNPPIDETSYKFEILIEKLNETIVAWDSLTDEDKTCLFKSTPSKTFIALWNRYIGRVDYPPDDRDDRPTATFLTISEDERDIELEYDPTYREDGNFAYLVSPVADMEDFEYIIEHILLPSRIFQISGVLALIRQHLPPDTRSWITDGQHSSI